jgi:uncharacterized protein (TIGR02172 family)
MREISIDNAELISKTIIRESYKLDEETMVTLRIGPEPLEEAEQERNNAKVCLELGVPAIFSFETVKCGDKYGTIYEQLHAKTMGRQIMSDPDHFDQYMQIYADTLKEMHSIHVAPGKLPSIKTAYRKSLKAMGELLTPEEMSQCEKLIDAVPEADTFLAMGFNPGTALYQDGQIFMNSFNYTSYGNPLFELADICESTSFVAAGATKDEFVKFLTNTDRQTAAGIWEGLLHRCFSYSSEAEYQKMNQLIQSFAMLKMTMTAVDVPNLHEEMKKGALAACRTRFLPYIEQLTEQVRNFRI